MAACVLYSLFNDHSLHVVLAVPKADKANMLLWMAGYECTMHTVGTTTLHQSSQQPSKFNDACGTIPKLLAEWGLSSKLP